LKVETTRFGSIDIKEGEIITMPLGMPGFSDQKKFVLLDHKKDSPFQWYQSIQDASLAFVITDPFLFKPDYAVNLHTILEELGWDQEVDGNHLKLYAIVNIPPGSPEKVTANLIGPVLMNLDTREAVQVIIPDSRYSHKFPLT
jgi:flagellar assembly factor FliW